MCHPPSVNTNPVPFASLTIPLESCKEDYQDPFDGDHPDHLSPDQEKPLNPAFWRQISILRKVRSHPSIRRICCVDLYDSWEGKLIDH